MKKFAVSVTLAATMLFIAGTSQAARFTFNLSGANESPPTASTASGAGIADVDPTTHTLSLNLAFTGLTTPATAAHIHCCTAVPLTGTAGVATPVPAFPAFPLGVTGGSYNQTLDLTQAASWNPAYITANGGTPASAEAALVAGINAGRAYFNIHTATNPGGEIRGFLLLEETRNVPTLSDWALGLVAALLAVMGFVTMRRRMG